MTKKEPENDMSANPSEVIVINGYYHNFHRAEAEKRIMAAETFGQVITTLIECTKIPKKDGTDGRKVGFSDLEREINVDYNALRRAKNDIHVSRDILPGLIKTFNLSGKVADKMTELDGQAERPPGQNQQRGLIRLEEKRIKNKTGQTPGGSNSR